MSFTYPYKENGKFVTLLFSDINPYFALPSDYFYSWVPKKNSDKDRSRRDDVRLVRAI